jgi:glycerophosphoryl diester phosphodiesterase
MDLIIDDCVMAFDRVVLALKSAGFVDYITILAGIALVVKVCHMFPNMFFLPGRKSRAVPLPKCTVIGHRGSCTEGVPENTLMSFMDAIDAGVDFIELDVWLTKDKKIVVHHDDNFARMTAGSCLTRVNDILYKDLPDIEPGAQQKHRIEEVCKRYGNNIPKEGGRFADLSGYKGEYWEEDQLWKRIPTLEEVLDVVPDHIGLICEVKDGQADMFPILHNFFQSRSQARLDNMYWFSLNGGIMSNLKKQDSTIPTCSHLVNIVRVVFLYIAGLAPFIDIGCDAFGIDMRKVDKERVYNDSIFKNYPNWIKDVLIFLFQGGGETPYIFQQRQLYTLLRKRGIPTYFLGANDLKTLHMAARLGASAVLTDRPHFISAYVKHNKLTLSDIDR